MLSTRAVVCAIALTAAAVPAEAAPRAVTRPAPECRLQTCAYATWSDRAALDAAHLTVEGLGPNAIRHYYRSDEGVRTARIVSDANGCNYVLLEYAVGRGKGPGRIVYLAVLHVSGRMELLRKVRLSYWLSPYNTAEYRYRIDKPAGGGLNLELTRRFTGKEADWRFPPPNQSVRVAPPD